ncbi:MAG: zinc ribbon domain-containing protein [Lachnospiraceae bacterium]|nr:zinc ribbon domain-containing protein [Lachnospiraceae bacterium]
MFCENCGTKLDESAVFCPECGVKVEVEEQNTQETVVVERDLDDEKTVIYEKSAIKETMEQVKTEEAEELVAEVVVEEAEEPVAEVVVEEAIAEEAAEPAEDKNEVVAQPAVSKVKYCHECGAANGEEDAFCYACGASFGQGGKKKPSIKLPIILGAAGVAVVAVICVFAFILSHVGKKESLMYLKDNEIMELVKKEGISIGDSAYEDEEEIYGPNAYLKYDIGFSEDGKYMFFPQDYENGYFTLYYRPVNNPKAESQKIDSDIASYSILKNNKVVYLKDDERLYISDLKDKEKVASDVLGYAVSVDNKKLAWMATEDRQLYICSVDKPEDKQKLDSDVTSVEYYSDDMKDVIYLKEDDLYHISGGNKEKIKSDVFAAVAIVTDKQDVIYYFVEEDEGTGYETFIHDDYAQADAAMSEPRIEDYQRVEMQQSFWGLREVVVTDDSYYTAWDEYNNKVYRDYIRESFEENDDYAKYQTMYCYDIKKKESEKYTQGLFRDNSVYQTSVFFYNKVNEEEIEKINLSELVNMSEWEISNEIDRIISEAMNTYLVYNGKEVEVDIDYSEYEPPHYVDYLDEKNQEVYFALSNRKDADDEDFTYEYTLFKVDFGKGDVEVFAENFNRIALGNEDGIYYLVEAEEEDGGTVGELYFNDTKIDSDVSVGSVKFLDDGTGVMYLTDLDSENYEGTLKIYKNGKDIKIADDVASYESNESGKIIFLQDYNFKKNRGELKLYSGKEAVLIDSDVTAILYY